MFHQDIPFKLAQKVYDTTTLQKMFE